MIILVLVLGIPGCNQPDNEPAASDVLTANELAQLLGIQAWKLHLVVPPQKDSLHIGAFIEEKIRRY